MQMMIDLMNPADVRAALEILPKYLTSEPGVPGGSVEERFINNLWPRIGRHLRELLKELEKHTNTLTIETLAKQLGRSPASVKASLNGPLARAVKSSKQAVPGAPDLLVWQHNGTVYEMRLAEVVREALASKSVESDFDAIPQAD